MSATGEFPSMTRSRTPSLGNDHVDDLFPLLARSTALEPLVVVLIVLASLPAVITACPDVESCTWIERALGASRATTPLGWLIPGSTTESPLRYMPPGLSWLYAGLVYFFGPSMVWEFPKLSLVFGTAGVYYAWKLIRRWCDFRVALFTALLLAVHGLVLRLDGSAAPWALGWALTSAGWVYLGKYLARGSEAHIRWVLLAGVLLGAAVLVGGSVVIVSMFAMFIASAIEPRFWKSGAIDANVSRKTVLPAIGIASAIAIVLSGWWVVLIVLDGGLPALGSWCLATRLPNQELTVLFEMQDFTETSVRIPNQRTWFVWLAPLIGWQIAGAWWLFRHRREGQSRPIRLGPWIAAAILANLVPWLLVTCGPTGWGSAAISWQTGMLLPTTLLAAIGAEGVARRFIHGQMLAAIAIVMGLCMALNVYENPEIKFTPGTVSVFTACLATGAAVIWWRTLNITEQEVRRRGLRLMMIGMMVAVAVWGYSVMERPEDDFRALDKLLNQMREVPGVSEVRLLAPRGLMPPQIRLAAETAFPDATFTNIDPTQLSVDPNVPLAARDALIVEWSRRDLQSDLRLALRLKVEPLGDPIRFRGRRLSTWMIKSSRSLAGTKPVPRSSGRSTEPIQQVRSE